MNAGAICKTYRFEAAHQLPFHNGKCANLHGHSYIVEVELLGEIQDVEEGNPESGMVVDFQSLDRIVKPLIEKLDHSFLNDHIAYSTAENIATWIAERIDPEFKAGICVLERVRVYETANCWAEWRSGLIF